MRVSLKRRVLITNRRAAARAWIDRGAGAVHTGPLHRSVRRRSAPTPRQAPQRPGDVRARRPDEALRADGPRRQPRRRPDRDRAHAVDRADAGPEPGLGRRAADLAARAAGARRAGLVRARRFRSARPGARARHAARTAQAVATDPSRQRPCAPHRRERRTAGRAGAAHARRRAADAAHGRAGRHAPRRQVRSRCARRGAPGLVGAGSDSEHPPRATVRASSSTSARALDRSGRRICPAIAARAGSSST